MEPDLSIKESIGAFLRDRGLPSNEITLHTLAGDGSTRIFRRITLSQPGPTFIAMENNPVSEYLRRENQAYLMIGRHLFQKGLPLPEIHRFDLQKGWFIMEDMGDISLQDEVASCKDRIALYEKVLEILFRVQIEGSIGFNTEWCYQTERYDRSVIRHNETDYFRDAFLCNYLGMKKDWPELEGPFDHLAETSSCLDNHHFLHRDFQSRNIMIYDGKIGILDWQGARLGPLPYDLASLLIDPYTDLHVHEIEEIYQLYLRLLKDYQPTCIDPFKRYYPYLAIQRNLQILGAFSYLTKVQGKTYFETYIPPAVRSLNRLLDELGDPQLSSLTDLLNDLPY